jgi:D-alanyl-lipoteichoic acid acyltransferase DltB (MBOAT superfamily)
MDMLAGVLFGLAIVGLGYLTRQGQAISFYSTVLIAIALVYVLFAVMAGVPEMVLIESAIAVGFVALAVVGARWPRRRWAGGLIAAGLVLHGGFDLVHDALIQNPVVPPWWPVFCAVVDVVVGAWLVRLVARPPRMLSAAPARAASFEE